MVYSRRPHLIIEGMDGSGKDTLIEFLRKNMEYRSSLAGTYQVHPRASTSLGGPVPDLAKWAMSDLEDMYAGGQRYIYNRHPLISEPIYAPVRLVNPGLLPPWDNKEWVESMRELMMRYCILVICQPPFGVVRQNLGVSGPRGHMPGVVENMADLYVEYTRLTLRGVVIRYDYTINTPADLLRTINHKMQGRFFDGK